LGNELLISNYEFDAKVNASVIHKHKPKVNRSEPELPFREAI
jgi:hypothetical protein